MSGVLDGIRVIDFGQYLAGPLTAELLAQNGADVIHVDPPSGPRLSGIPDAYLNRGKRRIVLDLHAADDLATARRLCEGADVVIENFRPGVLARLGLPADDLLAANPGLVYCALPGFAAADPRSKLPAWEGVVLSATAGYRRLREHWDWKARNHNHLDDPSRPLFTPVPMASTTAALIASLRIVSALYQRHRTGGGAVLEVPLAEAMLEVVGFHLEMPDFAGPRDDLPKAFLGSFRCSDGKYLDQVSYPKFVQQLLEAAGEWDSWCADGLSNLPEVFFDPTTKHVADRRFADLVATRPAAYWEDLVLQHGSAAARVRTAEDWLDNEHALQSRTVVDLPDPDLGLVRMAGVALELDATPVRLRPRTLPGDDAAELHALAPPTIPAANGGGEVIDEAPLAGVSVVEFSQVVAGPLAGRLLADLGADVVKVANPAPGGNNGFHGSYTNRGKHTAYLDVQDPTDRALLDAAISSSDLMLQNYAYGAIERYGWGYEDLHARHPDLVYVSLGAYSRSGPWRHRRGHENQAVAVSGLSARYGGHDGWPMYQPYLICDVGTGIMGAFAAVLGLYHRLRTGSGQHISTSLTNVATLHQATFLFAGGSSGQTVPSGLDAYGWSALQRLYRAADGWLFLAAAPDATPTLLAALGLEAPAQSESEQALAERIATVLATDSRARWSAQFAPAGIVAQPVRELDEVANDPVWHDRGILRHGLNGEGKRSPVLGICPAPWPAPDHVLEHPGALGSDTAHVRDRISGAAPVRK